ncbi:hypothetical protein GOODEAATRI_018355 [Goodea atripinnis]|uniref:Uncharacterized protein n=1 Tax=Goodea atripinnis TaxID=208336 RepID=A0ABV0N2G5_9TELE
MVWGNWKLHFRTAEGWGSISGTRMQMLTDGEQEAGENEEERSLREKEPVEVAADCSRAGGDIPTVNSSSCGFWLFSGASL